MHTNILNISSSTNKLDEVSRKKLNIIKDQVENAVAKKLILIILLCTLFMISEIIGGVLANSLAIICDAFHLLSDLGGFIISLFSSYLASRKATKKMNFGYRRLEILGAFSSIIIIWLLTGALLYIAITRIINADYEIDSKIMITMASIGVAFNAIMAFVLSYSHKPKEISENRRSSRFNPPKIIDSRSSFNEDKFSFSKLDDFQEINNPQINENEISVSNTEKINAMVSRNINIRAAFIHIVGDLIQSIGVLVASGIIYFRPSWKIADPACTIVFSVIVLSTTLPIMSDIMNVLSESFPKQVEYDNIIKMLINIEGVKSVNELKVWYLSIDLLALNAKIQIEPKSIDRGLLSTDYLRRILEECQKGILKIGNFEHINIQLEIEDHFIKSAERDSDFNGRF